MKPTASSKAVTLRDIAKHAGVSICTVSLSLRNAARIPVATRRRIQKIARELGYRPNAMVSTLMARIHTRRTSAESPVLGLIIEERSYERYDTIPFYQDLLVGARDRAFQFGYQLERFSLRPGRAHARVLGRALHARNIRGVIVAPLIEGRECLLRFDGLAACALGYTLHKPDLHRVVPNYGQGMRLAWDKLLALGYRRPGYVESAGGMVGRHYVPYASFLAEQALHPEVAALPPLLFPRWSAAHIDECIDECMELFMAWYRRHRPDVLLFPPWGLLKRLGEAIRIPEDAGVILTDKEPGWCLVHQGGRDIGAGAVDLVVAQIHRNETGVPEKAKLVAISSEWVDGFSLPVRRGSGRKKDRVRTTPWP